ncbi:MAG: radical SAM protein [Deferrisomatales bacterium]|nr:radical SAM protein [Deferrisomatales bacterium]
MSNVDRTDIVLVNPRHRFGKEIFRSQRHVVPLSLLAVATPVDAAGYRVEIIDQKTHPQWKKRLLAALQREPLCVGLTCKSGPQIAHALEISRLVKQHSSAPVVWGGVHPSLLPAQTLENEFVDIVVQGEGEETFLELVDTLKHGGRLDGVKGIWYKANGELRGNPTRPLIDLNQQPPLAYHLVDVHEHLEMKLGNPLLRTFTSRGCAYKCTFCYNVGFNQAMWRGLSAEKTIERLLDLATRYDLKGFIFSDDNFFGDLDRARRILEGLTEDGRGLVLAKLDIRADILYDLDDDFLWLMKKAGCSVLNVGLESGSERILKLIKKGITIPQILAINSRLKPFDIIPKYSFIMGYPTETREELGQTVSFILHLIAENPDIVKSLNFYTPLPGTELMDLAVEHGFSVPERLEDWIPFNYRTVNLPWLSDDRKKLMEMLHCCTNFLENHSFFDPKIDIHPIFRHLAKLYRPFARFRVEKMFYRLPLEIRLFEALGLYKKQA